MIFVPERSGTQEIAFSINDSMDFGRRVSSNR